MLIEDVVSLQCVYDDVNIKQVKHQVCTVKMAAKTTKQGFIHLVLYPTLVDHNISGMELICRCLSSS